MKVGIVDNYDSFTYNLVHYMEDITGAIPSVMLNDKVIWEELNSCTHIILSPGPGLPGESGDLMQVIERYSNTKHLLGVCLGMQAIGLFFGAKLKNLDKVHHGEQSLIKVTGDLNGIYQGLDNELLVGRYHSWVLDRNTIPNEILITSTDEMNEVMSIKHVNLPIAAVQYHPESIMTPEGKNILQNWIEYY